MYFVEPELQVLAMQLYLISFNDKHVIDVVTMSDIRGDYFNLY
jgi:hypothetical protein